MRAQRTCDACEGRGVRFPCAPSCIIPALKGPWIVIEKCDACDRFPDDLSAALTFFRVAGSFLCAEKGEHVLADRRTRKDSRKEFRGVSGSDLRFHKRRV
jgi:hypothetical protein